MRHLPACSTTGIGSLPSTSVADALAHVFQHDIPFLPELPNLSVHEQLIPAALGGLHISVGTDGRCILHDGATAVSTAHRLLAAEPFFQSLNSSKHSFAKVQLAGPVTLAALTQIPDGRSVAEVPELAARITQHVAAKMKTMIGRVRSAGVRPMVFFDEPILSSKHLPLDALEFVRRSAKAEGAIVGVHCCGQARWSELLSLGFDVIALDAGLSLEALLEDGRAWKSFVSAGGTLSLGLIPTHPGAQYDVEQRCRSVVELLRTASDSLDDILAGMILTPACGLARHSEAEAARVMADVRAAQAEFRALLPKSLR